MVDHVTPAVAIDFGPYYRRNRHLPTGRNEIWLIMQRGSGWAQWYRGPYAKLRDVLAPGEWVLYAPSQNLTADPKGFITDLEGLT